MLRHALSDSYSRILQDNFSKSAVSPMSAWLLPKGDSRKHGMEHKPPACVFHHCISSPGNTALNSHGYSRVSARRVQRHERHPGRRCRGEVIQRGVHDFDAFTCVSNADEDENELKAALRLVLDRVVGRRAACGVLGTGGAGVRVGHRRNVLEGKCLRFFQCGVQFRLAIQGVECLQVHQLLRGEHEVAEHVLILWVFVQKTVLPETICLLCGDDLRVDALVRLALQTCCRW